MSDSRYVQEMEAKRRVAIAIEANMFYKNTEKVKTESPSLNNDRAFCALVIRNNDDSPKPTVKQHLHCQEASSVLSGRQHSAAYPTSVADLLSMIKKI